MKIKMNIVHKRLLLAFFIAFGATAIDVTHNKIGGLLAGGNYSDPHTWGELYEMLPSFIIFFILAFVIAFFFMCLKIK